MDLYFCIFFGYSGTVLGRGMCGYVGVLLYRFVIKCDVV